MGGEHRARGWCLRIRIIGLEALLVNKRSTKRLKDAADVEELERLRALGEMK